MLFDTILEKIEFRGKGVKFRGTEKKINCPEGKINIKNEILESSRRFLTPHLKKLNFRKKRGVSGGVKIRGPNE